MAPDDREELTPAEALERLRRDPAIVAAEPDVRVWLLALLASGERASSRPESRSPDDPPVSWHGWHRTSRRARWRHVCSRATAEECHAELDRLPLGGDRLVRQGARDPNEDGAAERKPHPRERAGDEGGG